MVGYEKCAPRCAQEGPPRFCQRCANDARVQHNRLTAPCVQRRVGAHVTPPATEWDIENSIHATTQPRRACSRTNYGSIEGVLDASTLGLHPDFPGQRPGDGNTVERWTDRRQHPHCRPGCRELRRVRHYHGHRVWRKKRADPGRRSSRRCPRRNRKPRDIPGPDWRSARTNDVTAINPGGHQDSVPFAISRLFTLALDETRAMTALVGRDGGVLQTESAACSRPSQQVSSTA